VVFLEKEKECFRESYIYINAIDDEREKERERERESLLRECTTRLSSSGAPLLFVFLKKYPDVTKEYLHSSRRVTEKRIATKQQMQSSFTKSTSSFLTSSRRLTRSSFSRSSGSFSGHKQQQQLHKRKSFVTKAGAEEEELMQKLMAMIGGGGAPSMGRPPKGQMIAKESAMKGRDSEMRVTEEHYVLVR